MNKKALISLIAILVLAGAGYYFFGNKPEEPKNLIYYREPTLTAEEKTQAEEVLKQAEERVSNLAADASSEEKFNAFTFLGNQYSLLGRLKEARAVYVRATDTEPANYSGWANLAFTETSMGDLEAAHEHFVKATETTFRPDPWMWLIAFEKEKLGASNKRIEELYLDGIVKTSGFAPDVRKNYAIFLEQEKGDVAGALEQWRKALEELPESQTIKAEIERLEKLVK